jgi:hypothetical protein
LVRVLVPGRFEGTICWLHPEYYRKVITMVKNEEVVVPMSCISEINMVPDLESKDEEVCSFKPERATKTQADAPGVTKAAGLPPHEKQASGGQTVTSATSKAAAKKKPAPTPKKNEAPPKKVAEDLKIHLHDRQPAHTKKCEEHIEP